MNVDNKTKIKQQYAWEHMGNQGKQVIFTIWCIFSKKQFMGKSSQISIIESEKEN